MTAGSSQQWPSLVRAARALPAPPLRASHTLIRTVFFSLALLIRSFALLPLLPSTALAARRPEVLQHIFSYAAVDGAQPGRVTVQLWEHGQWRRVVIDDRLPCGKDRLPLYARSVEPNELWVALLEKAFAKRYGCYEALVSGFADVAMRDLTGGAPQRLRLSVGFGAGRHVAHFGVDGLASRD